jgi:hypothetical protein
LFFPMRASFINLLVEYMMINLVIHIQIFVFHISNLGKCSSNSITENYSFSVRY